MSVEWSDDVPVRVSLDLGAQEWGLWCDVAAPWEDDPLFLPQEVDLRALPVNPPTIGWADLDARIIAGDAKRVTLPTTVEEHFWARTGPRPFSQAEYYFAKHDPQEDGLYRGVSWWWTDFRAPPLPPGKRAVLRFSGVRLRVEVFLNEKLVGYDLVAETPFVIDATDALKSEGENRLALRITNPGGRVDWIDYNQATNPLASGAFFDTPPMTWGGRQIPMSHGFGGVDRGVTLEYVDTVHVEDIFVRNLPDLTSAVAEVTLVNNTRETLSVILACQVEGGHGAVWERSILRSLQPGSHVVTVPFGVAGARAWTPTEPALYRFTASLEADGECRDSLTARFGFRWFTVTGLGSKAALRLNGRRFHMRSAISWNIWAGSGLWPTDTQVRAEHEVAAAMGLNTLHCHRNIGNARALDWSDETGLLRWEEPGAGREAWAGTPFARGYMREKIRRMVIRDRNRPSLVGYCLQNEQVPEAPEDPGVREVMAMVKSLDPTRIIVLKSGFAGGESDIPQRWRDYANKQAFHLPGDATYYHDDGSGWSGWWDSHTVGGPGIYQSVFYRSPTEFSHRATRPDEIVFWGEALGSGTPDALGRIAAHYSANPDAGGFNKGPQLAQHAAYDRGLDLLGARSSFPDVDALTRAVGDKTYDFWRRMIENMRISDDCDGFALSGWESAAVDNHCGIVDCFRNPKGDAAIIARANPSFLVCVKPRRLVAPLGARIPVDVFTANETGWSGEGKLTISVGTEGSPQIVVERRLARIAGGDVFAELQADGVVTPALTQAGLHRIEAHLRRDDGTVLSGYEEVLVLDDALILPPRSAFAEHGRAELGSLLSPLGALPWRRGVDADLIVVADRTGESAAITPELLAQVEQGAQLVLLADGSRAHARAAGTLAELPGVAFDGMVGPARVSWTGSWCAVCHDPLFDGLPTGMCMGWTYQADPRGADGRWMDIASMDRFGDGAVLYGPAVETVALYGRDHEPRLGAAVSRIRHGRGTILLSGLAGLEPSLGGSFRGFDPTAARRILANAARLSVDRRGGG